MKDMKDMTKFKVATTSELKRLNRDAVANKRNRVIWTDNLDPDGIHVLKMTWWLDDMETCRTEWLVKSIGSDAPVTVFIDVNPVLLDQLSEV
jgi:hypothetical protein